MMSLEHERMNTKMANVAPELSSSYAIYPLRGTHWVETSGTISNGDSCFVANGDDGLNNKIDYVHGPGPHGRGYYHLLTRHAYVILYTRLHKERPGNALCCCINSKDVRDAISDHDEVESIVYNRSVASKPDDYQAAKDAIAKSQGIANNLYNVTQTEQLIVMAVT